MTDLTSRRPARAGIALATVAALFSLPAPAHADRTVPESRAMPHCSSNSIDDGKVMRDVQILDRGFQVTHSVRKRIARGTEFSRTITLGSTNQVTASISGTTTIKADAGAFFAKASAEASVTLAGNKQKTTTESLEERFTIPPKNKDRLFVFYDGVATYRFRAHKRVCNRGGEQDSFGKLSSWDKTYENGNVLCPHTLYRTNSPKFQIAVAGGC
jgi:hypothetical protein